MGAMAEAELIASPRVSKATRRMAVDLVLLETSAFIPEEDRREPVEWQPSLDRFRATRRAFVKAARVELGVDRRFLRAVASWMLAARRRLRPTRRTEQPSPVANE